MSPTPKAGYRLKSGAKVPGVTTVIGQWGLNRGALMYWAWKEGHEGRDFREERDTAADLGTLIHTCIEAELRGRPLPEIPTEHKEKAENALLAFYEWRDGFQLEVTGSEVQLISETHEFGGTIDYPVKLKGRRAILDLKTSREVYADHRVQLSAYGRLWDENFVGDRVQGHHLLRVGKEDGSFAHHFWPNLSKEWEAFLHLRALYDLAKALK